MMMMMVAVAPQQPQQQPQQHYNQQKETCEGGRQRLCNPTLRSLWIWRVAVRVSKHSDV